MQVVLNAPFWFVLLCLFTGFVYSFLLYFFRRRQSFEKPWSILLPVVRFIVVSIIAFLLLSPLVKTIQRTTEKPVIVLAHDNSESVIMNRDSSFYQTEYLQQWDKLKNTLAESYDIKTYTFGQQLTPEGEISFTEKLTDISGLMDEITTRYYHRNLGAVILASDGIYNHGTNPLHQAGALNAPVFSIALGDTSVQRDVFIRNLVYNKVAFAGNRFQLEIQLAANRCKGELIAMQVRSGGELLHSRTLNPVDDEYSENILLTLEAGKAGIKRFRVSLTPLDGEVSLANNYRDFYIEVLENRLKIAIIAQSPHPDIAAFKFALESNRNYEVESFIVDKFNQPVASYNLIILHQLPGGSRAHEALISNIRQAGVPVLFVVGRQTHINGFNAAMAGVRIVVSRQGFNESLPVFVPDFSLFGLNLSTINALENFPPLLCWFADYRLSNAAAVLLRQRIGRVSTAMPLMMFFDDAGYRSAVLMGEGIWKWRLSSYAQNQHHEVFNELINKIARYLSLKADKDFFRVYGENVFDENQPVTFFAEVYNDNYELVNDPEVSFIIRDSLMRRFDYAFSRRDKDYSLNAGLFPPGDYSWESTLNYGGKQGSRKGSFSISETHTERIQTRADHRLLYQLADISGGKFFLPEELDKIPDAVKQHDEIKPLYRTRKRLVELIDFKWIFVLLLSLLALEWVARKRQGSY